MSSTARVKRPFAGASADPSQRQITSFFGAPQSGAAPHAAESARQQPVLPANVQSNLLSVGMRIRKSVPEGYKTEGHSAFKLWTDNTTPDARKVRASARVASRELLPFCGINKVGGFESQPAFRPDDDDVPDEDAVPELTMSQETVDGSETATPSRKRILDDDEDAQQLNGELSPGGRVNARPLAVPRSRMKKGAAAYRGAGQENVKADGDFEDAEFLVFDEEQDLNMVV
ncbi:Ribonucleotide reductase inhibitor [Cordyceps fumosorosea ARSEF 2679]|uniref:Ribonucleotide reductase inhibitor n=1 Tax=Cordyceps fumosorosea (strain ARSEF 2679) TaxID=1081104 RepID=A0A162IBX7_CORFA|nr:Ribonucleotide reductase inhibitor [Cordyceps fumosorosea ARSEF 2679]OAA54925.1 Ribonucleotide reductase inhibitor [Cordyceps fumosorosea ARSEF 2679]